MYQKTIVIGHLGRDPEMRYTPTGVPVTSFSVATSRKWTNQNGETTEKTTWFRVTCWRKLAEFAAQYLKKGSRVLVEGDIDASAYTDREGSPRASLELTATNIRFMSSKDENTGGGGGAPNAGGGQGGEDFPTHEDDLPF
jgi:single-strand DNA-binding protein